MVWMMTVGRCSLKLCHPCLVAPCLAPSAPGCPFGLARSLCPDSNICTGVKQKCVGKLTAWLSIPQFKARIGGSWEIFLDCFVGWYLPQTSHQAGVTCSGLRLLVRTSQKGTSFFPVDVQLKIFCIFCKFIDQPWLMSGYVRFHKNCVDSFVTSCWHLRHLWMLDCLVLTMFDSSVSSMMIASSKHSLSWITSAAIIRIK